MRVRRQTDSLLEGRKTPLLQKRGARGIPMSD